MTEEKSQDAAKQSIQEAQEPKLTEISTLGEFGLIDKLTRDFPLVSESTVLGVGDDAAIIAPSEGKEILVTTDLLLEGIHFDVRYVPLKHLGYKAAVVNISDICAMNGVARQLTVSIGVSSRFAYEHIEEIYNGLRLACRQYGVDLVGGDTSASATGLVISVTCLGEVAKGEAVKRSGAKETDLICVSGDLGAAYMGLQLLERENQVAAQSGQRDFQPNFAGKEYILQRQLKPEARVDIVRELAEAGIKPTSMMDVSDGLSSELLHICKASHVGCRVYEDRIPIDYQTALMAEELNMNLVTAAMNGGEDYELLFTVPLVDKEKVEKLKNVRMIGYITKPELGAALVTRDGQDIPIRAQGWNAFSE